MKPEFAVQAEEIYRAESEWEERYEQEIAEAEAEWEAEQERYADLMGRDFDDYGDPRTEEEDRKSVV